METEERHHHHHHRDGSEQRSSGRKEHYSRRAGQNRHTRSQIRRRMIGRILFLLLSLIALAIVLFISLFTTIILGRFEAIVFHEKRIRNQIEERNFIIKLNYSIKAKPVIQNKKTDLAFTLYLCK